MSERSGTICAASSGTGAGGRDDVMVSKEWSEFEVEVRCEM